MNHICPLPTNKCMDEKIYDRYGSYYPACTKKVNRCYLYACACMKT